MSDGIDLTVPGTRVRLRVRTVSRWRALVGLLGRSEVRNPHGMWVKRCRRIHTFGLSQAVDIVFLRADGVVAKVVERVKPWRITVCREASTVLELRAGLARRLHIEPGVALDLLA